MHLALLYFIIVAVILLSASSIFFIKHEHDRLLKLIAAFSGSFLLSISFLNILPEIYGSHSHAADECGHTSVLNIGLFVIAGFLLQMVLELLTKGIEHGHTHTHEKTSVVTPFALMFGLCVHSFLEGMPIIDAQDSVQQTLAAGIVIHNIPISIMLASTFALSGMKKNRIFLLLLIFACMTPLGSVISLLLSQNIIHELSHYYQIIMAIVVGIFLHVSTSVLFEMSENHKYNIWKFIVVIFGVVIAFLIPHAH